MAERTQEQIDADDLLERAISAAVRAYNNLPEDSIVVDFLLIVEGQDLATYEESAYALLMRQGRMRASVALGLADIAHSIVTDGVE